MAMMPRSGSPTPVMQNPRTAGYRADPACCPIAAGKMRFPAPNTKPNSIDATNRYSCAFSLVFIYDLPHRFIFEKWYVNCKNYNREEGNLSKNSRSIWGRGISEWSGSALRHCCILMCSSLLRQPRELHPVSRRVIQRSHRSSQTHHFVLLYKN